MPLVGIAVGAWVGVDLENFVLAAVVALQPASIRINKLATKENSCVKKALWPDLLNIQNGFLSQNVKKWSLSAFESLHSGIDIKADVV